MATTDLISGKDLTSALCPVLTSFAYLAGDSTFAEDPASTGASA